jgi:dihydrofolate reductase
MKISLIAAVSVDGRIAAYPGHKSDWTSKEDKEFLHHMLDENDCVVVGRTTYELAREPLSKRNCVVFSRSKIDERTGLVFMDPQKRKFEAYARDKQYHSIAVLGGTGVYTYFLTARLLTDLYITIEPVVFGRGLPLFEAEKFDMKRFRLVSTRMLNQEGSIVVHYTR